MAREAIGRLEARSIPAGSRGRAVVFWGGAALALLGAAAIVFPSMGPIVIGAVTGWVLWFAGAIMLPVAVYTRNGGSFLGAVLTSLTAIAAGIYLLANPSAGALAAAILVTAVFLLDGATQLVMALNLRPAGAWRWIMTSAIASIVAAVLVAAGLPSGPTVALHLLLGLAFVTSGIAFMVLGGARSERP